MTFSASAATTPLAFSKFATASLILVDFAIGKTSPWSGHYDLDCWVSGDAVSVFPRSGMHLTTLSLVPTKEVSQKELVLVKY